MGKKAGLRKGTEPARILHRVPCENRREGRLASATGRLPKGPESIVTFSEKGWDMSYIEVETMQAVTVRNPPPTSRSDQGDPDLMVTRNGPMQRVLDELGRMARTEATILIQGESGTGKEVLARAIHRHSLRSEGPFVRVNCASLPEGVLESELFGHEKGAFTGAVRQRPGRFELAHQGTILLDEIGTADGKVQQRLLRVLQEREFERIGGTRTLRTDVRVVAATNVDLADAVKRREFREDLYYRLNVLPIELPPLRDRSEDIPLLIEHFLTRSGRRKRRPLRIRADAVEFLQQYPWPGNIRQLENILERMVILARGEELTCADIPAEVATWQEQEELAEMGATTYWEARKQFERRFLCGALRRHNGVITHVAEAIGISRKHLYMRLDQLRIDYRRYR